MGKGPCQARDTPGPLYLLSISGIPRASLVPQGAEGWDGVRSEAQQGWSRLEVGIAHGRG